MRDFMGVPILSVPATVRSFVPTLRGTIPTYVCYKMLIFLGKLYVVAPRQFGWIKEAMDSVW
jgi:hypothetical protein